MACACNSSQTAADTHQNNNLPSHSHSCSFRKIWILTDGCNLHSQFCLGHYKRHHNQDCKCQKEEHGQPRVLNSQPLKHRAFMNHWRTDISRTGFSEWTRRQVFQHFNHCVVQHQCNYHFIYMKICS